MNETDLSDRVHRYLKLGSKSDHQTEVSGNIARYDALVPRPDVLRSFSCLYVNPVLLTFPFLRKCKFPRTCQPQDVLAKVCVWNYVCDPQNSQFLASLPSMTLAK